MKNNPIVLGDGVVIGLSTVADGDMRVYNKEGAELERVRANIAKFLKRAGFSVDRSVLVKLDYSTDDFRKYSRVNASDAGRGISDTGSVDAHDALATAEKDLGLFLPLADCLGAVIFDPEHQVLMVSHLGRHSIEQNGGAESVKYLMREFGSLPGRLLIWLSPSAGKENYPLIKLGGQSIREAVIEQLVGAGVDAENISGDDIDTTVSPDYYSYSQAQKTGKDLNKRFAIVAKIV